MAGRGEALVSGARQGARAPRHEPANRRHGGLGQAAVCRCGRTIDWKMLGSDAPVPVKCIAGRPRVFESPYGVGPRFSSTGFYPECSATMRLHKGQSTKTTIMKLVTWLLGDNSKPREKRDAQWYQNDAQDWYSFYWWINFFLFWGIPILSTLLASNAFASLFPATEGVQPIPLVIFAVVLSIMTIVNSAIKPKDQYEKNAAFRIRFEQYSSTYTTQETRVGLYFKSDPDLEKIMNEWKEYKLNEFFTVTRAYLVTESVPDPEPFVYNGKAIKPSVPPSSVAVALGGEKA
jgi:hypothetical protein